MDRRTMVWITGGTVLAAVLGACGTPGSDRGAANPTGSPASSPTPTPTPDPNDIASVRITITGMT